MWQWTIPYKLRFMAREIICKQGNVERIYKVKQEARSLFSSDLGLRLWPGSLQGGIPVNPPGVERQKESRCPKALQRTSQARPLAGRIHERATASHSEPMNLLDFKAARDLPQCPRILPPHGRTFFFVMEPGRPVVPPPPPASRGRANRWREVRRPGPATLAEGQGRDAECLEWFGCP